jgi:hypothetical protein
MGGSLAVVKHEELRGVQMMRRSILAAGPLVALLVGPGASFAQFNGLNTKGDYGLLSASQPSPGMYLIAPMYVRYHADKFADRNGDALLPDERDSLDVNAYVLGFIYVSEFKILGANYSFQIFPAWTDNNLEIPAFGVDERTSLGFADLYFQPINLGWHTKRADYTAGVGIFAPTGSYEFGGDGNVGLGMWGFELFGGATAYFDEAQRWHFAATAFYETHSEKDGTDISVGDFVTLEGGLGRSFLDGAANAGLAYYAQWKVTDDDLGSLGDVDLPIDLESGRNRVYGVGPELTFPIATKKRLIAILNARFLWETGARTSLEGETFVFTATFPLPSVPLQ